MDLTLGCEFLTLFLVLLYVCNPVNPCNNGIVQRKVSRCDIFHTLFLYRIANSGLKNDSDNDEDDRDIDWSFTLDKKRKYW